MIEVIEPDGMSTIQISNTGGTSILKSGMFQGSPDCPLLLTLTFQLKKRKRLKGQQIR